MSSIVNFLLGLEKCPIVHKIHFSKSSSLWAVRGFLRDHSYISLLKNRFFFLHFSICYIFKNIRQKEYYMEQGSLIKSKWLFFTIFMFRKLHWENSFFDIRSMKKYLWIKESFVNSKKISLVKEIDLFTLKKMFLNQQNFLQFKEIFSLTLYQRNVSLIQRNCFLDEFKRVFALGTHVFSKSSQLIAFEFSTFILNINIYGVTKRFLKFLILS